MKEKEFLNDKMLTKGFDKEVSYFSISTLYQDKDYEELGVGETARLFRFEKRENKYKLVFVFCAG
jgi:hypothetical protein